MKVEAKSSSSGSCGKFIEVVIMLILIGSYYCFIHGYYCSTTVNTARPKLMLLHRKMVNILVSGEEYDIVKHLDMLHAPLEGKVMIITTAKTNSENDDQEMSDAEKIVVEKGDEEDEHANDDQAQEDQAEYDRVGTLVTMLQKEKPEDPSSSSSYSLSLNYGNEFLYVYSDTSLVRINKDLADTEINSLIDTTTTSTPTPLTTPLPTPPITSEVPPVTTTIPDPLPAVIKRSDDLENEDPSAGPNQGKKTKRRRTKESKSSKKSSTSNETSKGNTQPKVSSTDKTMNAEEIAAEPTKEVTMDAEEKIINDEVVNDAAQPQDDVVPKTDNAPKNNWFKQPPRPPTPDPEWNKCRVVDDQPEQTWFNDMVSAKKDPLTFDKLIATPIDFSKFVKNRLKLDKIIKADLVGQSTSF
ncbi:hypothetical protein Tco_0083864 [Tanacetum coccineum]